LVVVAAVQGEQRSLEGKFDDHTAPDEVVDFNLELLVLVDGSPVALFSGGSLLDGSQGRPDLLGRRTPARSLGVPRPTLNAYSA